MKPNIVILYCDQMQQKRLGFIDPVARTPNIDALAEESVVFSNAFTNHAQCSPSRAAFVTGQPAHQCGVMMIKGFHGHQSQLTGNEPMLAKTLKSEGYHTVHFGKNHMDLPLDKLGYDEGMIGDFQRIPDAEAESLGLAHVPISLRINYQSLTYAEEWLNQYEQSETPLFFVFSTNLPHPPFFSEPKYIDHYDPSNMQIDESYYKETFEGKVPFQKAHAFDGSHTAPDEDRLRREMTQFYSMIETTDEHFGSVIEKLKKKLDWDNTIVLLLSDHGDMMGAHKMRLKGTLPYDELYRVPCILKLTPGRTTKRNRIDDLVDSTGFAASLMTLAHLDVPDSFSPPCLVEAMDRDAAPDDERVFFEHYGAYWGIHPFYGVRTRKHKLVHYFGDGDFLELYDLQDDPSELNNLATDPAYASLVTSLDSAARDWWESTDGRDADFYQSDAFVQTGKAAM